METIPLVYLKNKKIIYNFFYLANKYKFKPSLMTNNLKYILVFLSDFRMKSQKFTILTSQKFLRPRSCDCPAPVGLPAGQALLESLPLVRSRR